MTNDVTLTSCKILDGYPSEVIVQLLIELIKSQREVEALILAGER